MVNRLNINQTRKVKVLSYGDNEVVGKAQDGRELYFTFNPSYQETPEIGTRVTIRNEGQGKWEMI